MLNVLMCKYADVRTNMCQFKIKKALSLKQDGFYIFLKANYWFFARLIASLT